MTFVNTYILDSTTKKIYPNTENIIGYIVIGIAFVVLLILAIIQKNVTFIKEHPLRFTIETLIMTLGTAIIVTYIFKFSRGIKIRNNITWISIMTAKLLIFHILLEISGIYDYVLKQS
jgi:hypothetical protein